MLQRTAASPLRKSCLLIFRKLWYEPFTALTKEISTVSKSRSSWQGTYSYKQDLRIPQSHPISMGTFCNCATWQRMTASQTPKATLTVTRSCSQKPLLLLLVPCELQGTPLPCTGTFFSSSKMAEIWICLISMTQGIWKIFSRKEVTQFSKDRYPDHKRNKA